MQRPLRAPLRCRPIRPTPSRSAIRLRGETRREGWPEPLICTHLRSSDQRRSAPISGSFRSLRLCVPCVLSRQNGIGHERAQRAQSRRPEVRSQKSECCPPLSAFRPRACRQTQSNPVKPDFAKRTHSDFGLRVLDFQIGHRRVAICNRPSDLSFQPFRHSGPRTTDYWLPPLNIQLPTLNLDRVPTLASESF